MQATLGSKRGIQSFFATLVVLAVLRVVLQSYVNVPDSLLPYANIAMGSIFLGGPLLALCFAARDPWSRQMAAAFVGVGVVVHGVCLLLNAKVFHGHHGVAPQIVNAIAQIAVPIWCVGLGALLATMIKDKNIVVPIAIFLAFLDMFFVFSPVGVTNIVLTHAPSVLPNIGVQVPHASGGGAHGSAGRHVSVGALAGPADFLFLAMFLITLFRFGMRAKETVLVVIPTLLAYMFLVAFLHFSLPALVPIGIVVLLVNWKEFVLTKDEKLSTALVAALGVGLFTWGMMQKPKLLRVDSSPKAASQESTESPR